MKLVQKKCPNCGAGLSFNDNDTNVKCEYCKQTYFIEKDEKKAKEVDDQHFDDYFNLVSDVAKPVVKTFAFMHIFGVVVFIVIAFVIFMITFGMFRSFNVDFDHDSFFDVEEVAEERELTELSDIDDETLKMYHKETLKELNSLRTMPGAYEKVGDWKQVGMYLLVPKDVGFNQLHDVYKVTYKNKKNNKTIEIYAGVSYSDIKISEDEVIIDNFNGFRMAPIYFLDGGSSYYVLGYEDLEEYYNKVIRSKTGDYVVKATEGMYVQKTN